MLRPYRRRISLQVITLPYYSRAGLTTLIDSTKVTQRWITFRADECTGLLFAGASDLRIIESCCI